MRRAHPWFEVRATAIWRVSPGRSFLLLVPQGCDEVGAARHLATWCHANFRLPESYRNHRPAAVRMSVDAVRSADQFVRRLRREFETATPDPLDVEDYLTDPSDRLESVIDAVHAQGVFPILVIERFHAFARIGDEDFLSILSLLRTLEHASKVTTLAISPLTYAQIRRQLIAKGQFPFVNSDYGDNHDLAVMTPLARADFVAAAADHGLAPSIANRVFSVGGGPDAVFRAIIDVAADGDQDRLIDRCVERLEDRIDRFLDEAFNEPGYDASNLLERLAVGELLPVEREAVKRHALAPFLAREDAHGRMFAVTPILARAILRRGRGAYAAYGDCLAAIAAGDHARACTLARTLDPATPRLRAFRDMAEVTAMLHRGDDQGLLGVDWARLAKVCGALAESREISTEWRTWTSKLLGWARAVTLHSVSSDDARQRLDRLTPTASDDEVYDLLVFALAAYVRRACRLPSPVERVRQLLIVPEAILQALAARFCGIDFSKPPETLPAGVDYDAYFEGRGTFRYQNSQKLELTSLLVVVPALLGKSPNAATLIPELADAARVRPLHQKLTMRLRNPTAHTYATLTEPEGIFFDGFCATLLNAMAVLRGAVDVNAFLGTLGEPATASMADVLLGGSIQASQLITRNAPET